jgi:RNA polymerase sigma-70 factor (ECF subfamily)
MESSNARSSVVESSGTRYSAHATELALENVVLEESEATGKVDLVQARAPRDADLDRDLVYLIHTGDQAAALCHLMRRYGAAIYRFCREALRDPTLADDVHQQIFLQVHRDLARFGERSSLRTWLFAIARNRVLDAIRSHRRAHLHIEDRDTCDVPDPSPSPGERIDDIRLHQALAACFAELDEHMRTVVLLHYQQGFTFEDMAEIYGEKPGTLQARVMRTLPKLRACIEARTGGGL